MASPDRHFKDAAIFTHSTGVTPNSGDAAVYVKSDNKLYIKDSSGNETSITTTGNVDNAILRADGTGGSTSQSSDLVIDDATTSTQNNVAIVNNHSETNSSVVITPKGTGAFIIGPKPDGTSTGGNARDVNAICMVRDRSAATQVASGRAAIAIGRRATASGAESVALHGLASGTAAIAIGYNGPATASNSNAIAIGQYNTSSAIQSNTFGYGVTASAANATALGTHALADRQGMLAFQGINSFVGSNNGQRQCSLFTLSQKTTTDSAVELTTTGATSGSGFRLSCRSGFVLGMLIHIVGVSSDGSSVAHYVRQYAVKNVGGTTSEVYAPVTIGTDNAASTSIALSADDTNDSVKIECTGTVSTVWRWHALVYANEIAYGT